jgi:hypothetical protein
MRDVAANQLKKGETIAQLNKQVQMERLGLIGSGNLSSVG